MDIKDIRLANLEKLISKEVSATVFAHKIEMSPSQLSQIRNPKYSRSVGNVMARRVEKIFALGHGWMDRLHDEPEALPKCLDYEPANAPVIDEKTAMMIEMFKHLTESQKADLLRVMEEKKQQNEQLLNELLARKA